MKCPTCGVSLRRRKMRSIKIDRCPTCDGSWYDADELRVLKDKEKRGDYRWLDFDLWRDREKFRAGRQRHLVCPKDGRPMTTVRYGTSSIRMDMCPECHGIWLDHGEYKKIVGYLEKRVNAETLKEYFRDLREEFQEIFTGPEGPLSELGDFLKVLYLLELRFRVEHPRIAAALQQIARGIPGA